eukprot:gene36398-44152_t
MMRARQRYTTTHKEVAQAAQPGYLVLRGLLVFQAVLFIIIAFYFVSRLMREQPSAL